MIGMQMEYDPTELERETMRAIEDATLPLFIRVGTRAVDIARKKMGGKPYQDDTGNLRSSTGFIVFRDGKSVHTDFKPSPAGTDKATGLALGQKMAEDYMRDSKGWGIVLVAGMDYASYVENKGFDVISGGSNDLQVWLTQAFNELGIVA